MINREEFRQIRDNGIWQQNTSLVQILGLCPLLAVTTNLVNGVMLSLATIIVMAIANLAVASLRNLIPHEIRIPVFILIVAAWSPLSTWSSTPSSTSSIWCSASSSR
jgi:electron transport complex protein RnfE